MEDQTKNPCNIWNWITTTQQGTLWQVRWSNAFGGLCLERIDGVRLLRYSRRILRHRYIHDRSTTGDETSDHSLQGLLVDFVKLGRYQERAVFSVCMYW